MENAMALLEKEIQQIREELGTARKPLFFFDDDCDGLCAFLLMYRSVREGKGIIVKSVPRLDENSVHKIHEYEPDKVFVLDIANVEQDFIDEAKAPVIWIDHHDPPKLSHVKQFNPRIHKKSDNLPTTFLCHQVVGQDLWIATTGCVADWFIPPFLEEFRKEYPDLIDPKLKTPPAIIYESKLGELIQVFSAILKGKTEDVMKCVRILTRIQSPYEILREESPAGRFIYRRYLKIKKEYDKLMKEVLAQAGKEKLVLFTYKDNKMSFTGDLSNELLYRFPGRVILIAREKSGEMRMSLRSTNITLPPILQKALKGLEGYGGGHEYACGASVKLKDFEEFVRRIKEQI